MAHFPLKRITSVVAAIFVVLLVTNTLGFSFHLSNLWPSRRLMHHNNFNHGNRLALTSAGVRQAQSKMVQTMSTASAPTTSQSSAPSKRRNILNVIYEQVDRRRTVKSDDSALDNLPITQRRFAFDRKSRPSGDLIENKPHQHFSASGLDSESRLSSGEWHAKRPLFESSLMNTESTTSTTSHREKRNIDAKLDTAFQLVKIQTKSHRWITLSSTGRLSTKPDDNFQDTQFLLIKHHNATAIYSIRHKKFVCFNNSTGEIIAQSCFDFSMCAFEHTSAHNVYEQFESVCKDNHKCVPGHKEKLKLGFKKNGTPINMKKYKELPSRIKNFHFKTIDLLMDDVEMHRNYSKLLQNKDCSNIWYKLGEKIFEKEIKQDPELECILTQHHELATPNCTKKEPISSPSSPHGMALQPPPDLSSTTTVPTPGTTQPSSLAAPSRNQKRMSPRGSTRCVKPRRLVRSKVRHRRKKSRTASC